MLDDQIIVTGGSKGIGAAIAKELAQRGRNVACLSRTGVAPAGYGIACDVTDEAAIVRAFEEVASKGPIRGLVNNAGALQIRKSAALSTEEYEQVMCLNATSVLIGSRTIYPHLKGVGGSIINIGSFFDKLGVPGSLAYCASKAAIGAMTRCLAAEWAADGISVMNVAPGYVETNLNEKILERDSFNQWLATRIPFGKPGVPEDVGRLVAAMFAEDIPFMTGETIYIDGGQGMYH